MDADAEKGYEFVDHTADVVVRAWGPHMAQVFEQAGLAMLSLLYDRRSVAGSRTFSLTASAEDRELLLAAWLNELLYQVEGRRVVFSALHVLSVGERTLTAVARGEPFDGCRHEVRGVVKGATLHDLSLRSVAGGWEGRVLLDV